MDAVNFSTNSNPNNTGIVQAMGVPNISQLGPWTRKLGGASHGQDGREIGIRVVKVPSTRDRVHNCLDDLNLSLVYGDLRHARHGAHPVMLDDS